MDKLAILAEAKKAGMRMTKVRQEMIRILTETKNPVDAAYLLEKLGVNKTSVYRELEALVKNGLVLEVEFGEGKKRYELTALGHHHHLICTQCKSITDVNLLRDLEDEEKSLEKRTAFKIEKHNLEFFGVCARCLESVKK